MFDSDLIIKGGAFGAPTRLKGILSKRMNITYGRNGSGKSTIARAFREQQPDRQAKNPGRNYSLSFDGSGSLKPEISDHVFVFNEDFIEKHVKVEDDELGPIVMLGDQVDITEKISSKTKEIEKLQGEYDELKAMCEKLSDDNNESSPKHKFKYLKYKLNAKDSWAERDNNCKIKAAKYNSAITNETR